MGEQPLFEMVALAAHVRPTLSTARNDSVAGDEERNLAQTDRERERKFNSEEINMCKFLQILCKNIFACKQIHFKKMFGSAFSLNERCHFPIHKFSKEVAKSIFSVYQFETLKI